MYICMYVCIYIYIYTHTCIHTHVCSNMLHCTRLRHSATYDLMFTYTYHRLEVVIY